MKLLSAIVYFAVLGLVSACDKNGPECDGDIFCTQDARVVNLAVVDGNGAPYALDSFYSFFADNQSVLMGSKDYNVYNLKAIRDNGTYPLAGDNMVNLSGKGGRIVRFHGYKNNLRVVDEGFVIGHDCCHVVLRSGKKQVVL